MVEPISMKFGILIAKTCGQDISKMKMLALQIVEQLIVKVKFRGYLFVPISVIAAPARNG